MSDTAVKIWFVVAVILCLIPVLLIAPVVYWIISAIIDDRRREARKIVRTLPGYGEFENCGDWYWSGQVGDVYVSLDTPQWPPDESMMARLATTLASLNDHAGRARAFIENGEGAAVWPDDATIIPYLIELGPGEDWVLEFEAPHDPEHVFRICFTNDSPTSYGLDG